MGRMLFGCLFILCLVVTSAQAQDTSATEGGFSDGALFGQITFLTNYIEKGISQTDSRPAIQAALGYKWTQARAGLWASNVKFRDSTDVVTMRLFGDYLVPFTANASLVVKFELGKYFNDGSRDGNIITADFNFFTYHVIYEKVENWESSEYDNQRFGFYKEFEMFNLFGLEFSGGYNMADAEEYSDFFDGKITAIYRVDKLRFDLGGTLTTNKAEFGGPAGPFAYFGIQAAF